MGSHSYLQNLGHCSGSACNQMHFLQQLNMYGPAKVYHGAPAGTDMSLQELLLGANGHGIWQHDKALQQLGVLGEPYVWHGLQELGVLGEPYVWHGLQELPFYLTPKEGQLAIVEADAAPEASETIEIPTMPEASGARPWTQESWNQWNLLQHNGTRHPDRPFSKKYGFEP